ncbi:1269_t:CDS:1, partial [Paraglomus occultum]
MRVGNPAVRKNASCSQCEKQKREFEELAEKVDRIDKVINEQEAEEEKVYNWVNVKGSIFRQEKTPAAASAKNKSASSKSLRK